MNIMFDSIMEFHYGGEKFKLPSKLVRYIEFENTVVFLLDENGKRDKIIGVKFSQSGGINHFYIDWEFQIIDGIGTIYTIHGMWKENFNNQEVIVCYSGSFDIQFYLNPENGKVINKIPIK